MWLAYWKVDMKEKFAWVIFSISNMLMEWIPKVSLWKCDFFLIVDFSFFFPWENFTSPSPKVNKQRIGQNAMCCFWTDRFFSWKRWQLHKNSIEKKLGAVCCVQDNEARSEQVILRRILILAWDVWGCQEFSLTLSMLLLCCISPWRSAMLDKPSQPSKQLENATTQQAENCASKWLSNHL